MVEATRKNFFIESKDNPISYGTYYKINEEFGNGFQWTSPVHNDFIITLTNIKFNQEVMIRNSLAPKYVLALYISGAGDEFYPYQNISPNTLRCYEPSEKYKAIYHPQISLKCISIEFTEDFVNKYLQDNYTDKEISFTDFFKEKNKFVVPEVNNAMNKLYNYLTENSVSPIYVELKIYEILTMLASHLAIKNTCATPIDSISKNDSQSLEELTNYLNEHYSFNISLHTLATIACMSESKMKKLFKSVYNMSITEYLQRKRLSVAEHMLIQTDLPISEISKIVGYSNPSRLIELFRRYYGVTPSKYRE